ncbi:MAG: Uma2 family endonuclease [Caldilinea sp. CFX5]|nr:Uma2 family endonuclease [Caldilinea sp. CFX5]
MANLATPVVKILETNHTAPSAYRNGHVVDELRSEHGKAVSEEVYWAQYYSHPSFSYEWNNGILEERPMPNVVEWSMYKWFLLLLNEFLRNEPIAVTMALETAFRLTMPHSTAIRKPDLGVILNSNQIPLAIDDRSYHGTFDLCIESLSDGSQEDIDRDVVVKRGQYELAGVREYFILDDGDTYMAFYYRTPQGIFAPIPPLPGGIIRSTVLPGFQFRIADLHRQPSLVELVDDPVYQPFIMPEYQAAQQRAEQERQRAEQAESAFLAEQQRSAQLIARLRSLGVTLDE